LIGHHTDGTEDYKFKFVLAPKYINAVKAVASAGKALVISAGNDGQEIPHNDFFHTVPSEGGPVRSFNSYLLENLDLKTRESVIFAGNLDPDTGIAAADSNKPGQRREVQEMFLFAPGTHQHACHKDRIDKGTSLAAPYISAMLANLLAKPGVTPKRAAQALKDSAQIRNGMRVMRVDKALELLEMPPLAR
jgi:hypothetical protein